MSDRPERVDLIIRGGTVVTVDEHDTIVQADVAVRDGDVVAVGPSLDVVAGQELDASGAAVLPGFVNSHMHETLDRGVFEDLPFTEWLYDFALPKDRAYEPRHMRAAAMLNQAEMIAGGTTTFIDIFRHPGEAAQVALDSGVRAIFSPQVITDPVGPGESLETNIAFVDEWHGRHDRISTWFGPHSLYSCDEQTYRTMRELADHYGVGIHTHLAESRAETQIISERTGGLTPVQYLDRLIGLGPDVVCAHCVELDDDDLALLATSGAGIACCATSNAKLGNGVARVPELIAAGARMGLGTDSIMTNNNLDMFEEMRIAALVQKQRLADPTVMPSAQVLRLATMGSACVLGMDERIGSIEIGKAADVSVVDLRAPHARPLFLERGGNVVEQVVWSCGAADVRHTVVDGAVLMRDRQLQTLDVDEVGDLADHEARHLLTRAGVFERRFGRPPA